MNENEFPPSLDELIENFEMFEEWDEKYEYLVELGRELPPPPDGLHSPENKVEGCMSSVWMTVDLDDAKRVHIVADSDSLIVKGLLVILLAAYEGKTVDEVLNFPIDELFQRLSLMSHLSPNRRNGLFAMVCRIKNELLSREAENPASRD